MLEDIKNQDSGNRKAFEGYQKLFSLSEEDLQKDILDVGAGSGLFVDYLRNILGNNRAYGVERYSQKIKAKDGVVVASGLELPFEDNQFDLVLSKNYLPMFVDDHEKMKKAIHELLRVIKAGGKLIADISIPEGEIESEKEFIDAFDKDSEGLKKFREHSLDRYEGSKSLQDFLNNMNNGSDFEFSRRGGEPIIEIKKLK
jgi:ubiquinone/menaquinone biosynthesis C-methylase UbiE